MHQGAILRSIKTQLDSALRPSDVQLRIARIVARIDSLIPVCTDADVRHKMFLWKSRLQESIDEGTARSCAAEFVLEVVYTMQPSSVEEYLCAVLDFRYDRNTDWEALIRTISAASAEGTNLAIDPPWPDSGIPVLTGSFDKDKLIYVIGYTNPSLSGSSIDSICQQSALAKLVDIFQLKTLNDSDLLVVMGAAVDATAMAASVVRDILRRID